MNNKELGKKAAKGVLGAATAVGIASAAGIDMSGIIRRISISLIGLGLLLGFFLGIAGEDANLFFALTGIGIFLAAVWFLIATLATWIFTGSTKSKKSTELEGERSEFLDDEQNQKKTIKNNLLLIGDSYVQGMCLDNKYNLNSQFKKFNLNSTSLGIGGNGVTTNT